MLRNTLFSFTFALDPASISSGIIGTPEYVFGIMPIQAKKKLLEEINKQKEFFAHNFFHIPALPNELVW
jgi:hypothetical protein